MGGMFSKGTATAQSDQTAGLSFQRRDILNQRKLLDESEQNRKDDGYSKAAIERERQRLDFLENCEDIRELLDSTVIKFQENLMAMKTASDALYKIDNLPGEVTTFCRRIDDACKDGDDTERALSDFKIQANVFYNKNFEFQMKANELSVEDLKVQSDELIRELNKLKELNKFILLCSTKMNEKFSKLNLDTLKSLLEKSREQLKSDQWKLIRKGIGASILAISGIGVVVGIGVSLWKLAPGAVKVVAGSAEELKDIGSATSTWVIPKISEYFSDVSRNREELKSMEQCFEVLNGLNPLELNTDQLIMELESTLSEAQNIKEQMDRRLKEAEIAIKSEQKIVELEQLVRQQAQEIETLKRAQTKPSNQVNLV